MLRLQIDEAEAKKNAGCTNPHKIPVTMAKGTHLFPYRTQKLSLSAPMVLGWRRPGRVGRCRIPHEEAQQMLGFFFLRFWKKNDEIESVTGIFSKRK